MIIELDDIVKTFGKLTVVNHVSITIRDSEFFTLLGPSGCGKTTLLRMIAGFNNPNSGDIRFDGQSIVSLPAHKRGTGMVFQNYALFPHLTVFDNVAYGLHAQGVASHEIKPRVMEMLDVVKLGGLASRYPRQLSGGQQQRVALARSLVIRPRVLLMDEPLSNLDAKLRVSMREEIRRIQKSLGIATVYVTHDQEEAMAVSDRIAIFFDGHLQQVDTPQGIYFHPVNRFTAEFMGSCTILPMTAKTSGADGPVSAIMSDGTRFIINHGTENVRPGDELLVMLRPDWFTLAKEGDQNCFSATITETMFLGSNMVYRVNAFDQSLRIDVPVMQSMNFREPGQSIEISFSPDRPVLVRP